MFNKIFHSTSAAKWKMTVPLLSLGLLLSIPIQANVTKILDDYTQQVSGTINVKGVVKDAKGEPMVGVTIRVVGNESLGTISDVDGNYSLTSVPKNSKLRFTYVGYKDKIVDVLSRPSAVVMEEDAETLNEVVVVGYTTLKAKHLSGSIGDIQNDELMKTQAVKTASALTGKIAGISTRQKVGKPGSGADIQIRNLGTPLFVIDGIQKDQGQFDNIDPTDIESITVLKDASAAIYGIQASNGVVIVTTKSGKYGTATKLDISFRQGWQNFTYFPKMANAAQWVDMRVEEDMNMYGSTSYTREEYNKWQAGKEKGYQSFDWMDYIIKRNAPQNHFNISATGGSEKTKYYLSFNSTYQDGMFRSNDFKRQNIQSNVESEIAKGLKIAMNLNGRVEQYNSVATTLNWDDAYIFSEALFRNRPTERPYANDNPLYPADNGARGYVNTSVYTGENANPGKRTDTYRVFQGNLKLTYAFPENSIFKGLSATGLASYYYSDETFDRQQKAYKLYTYLPETNEYKWTGGSKDQLKTRTFASIEELVFRCQLTYNREFGKHAINAFAAAEANKRKNPSFTANGKPTTDALTLMQTSEFTGLSDSYSKQARAGFLGSVNYVYNDRYILEVSGRYDGSYKFAKGHRWGFFPSVSAAYRMSSEDYWKNLPWGSLVDNFKIRTSYGKMGDDNVTEYLFYDGYNAYQGKYVMEDGKVAVGFSPRGIPSTTLSWIKTSLFNVGFDWGMLNNKLTGSFDFFERTRTGLPASKNDIVLPTEVGFGLPQYNLNGDRNIGWDASVSYKDKYRDFNYEIIGNVGFSRKKITKVYNPQFSNSLDYYNNNTQDRWSGGYWGFLSDGQFTSQEQIDNWPIDNDGRGNRSQRPGDIIYKDLDKNGVIDNNDKRIIGYPNGLPLMTFSITMNGSWKGFDISMQWQGATKYQHYREWELMKFAPGDGGSVALVADRWHRSDPFDLNSEWIPGRYPSIGTWNYGQNNNYDRPSDYWMSNVNYLRLKELEVGYTIPKSIMKKVGVNNMRVFVNGTNLLTFDNLDYCDPETGNGNGVTYPPTKLLSVGFKIEL